MLVEIVKNATCRVALGVFGAVVAVRQEHAPWKDALAAFRLLSSPHTEGLTVAQTVEILFKARMHKIDPWDLWMVFDGYVCDDLDHAVTKTLEIRALYDRPFSNRYVN